MTAAQSPLPMTYLGNGQFQVPKGHIRRAEAQFGAGEYVVMAVQDERSAARHRAFFAQVRECWKSLPEAVADNFPTDTALRKGALIATGWCDQTTEVFRSNAEARRAAELVRRFMAPDTFPLITISGCALVVMTAKSQAVNAMGRDDFNASSEAALKYLAEIIGSDPHSIPKEEAA